ncbi:hypothetical protein BACCIP111895_03126 [Neobacillus rhizosphaerae]|uniref:DUF3953 domain-containing protein n=1 Tax=Neobacillus rhizosphaerae TaxID=2880965 RepID=A0ABM9EUW7_9BACI|nr:hypothetical protein [Neobacillus rhizosphaerae]CAH2715942.1 hypothetical protein BACCIP111895_03126 [Neobacillus rhizosphaerae]
MELGIKKKAKHKSLPTISGFLSFLIALISLAGLNVALLIKEKVFPGIFIYQLPMLSIFLGIIGLFTRKRSRLYAIWGISLSIFLFIFTLLMVVSSLSINYKP